MKEEEKLNTELWEARFNLTVRQKATNTRYACEEYSSPCPACGGSDRVSVFQGVGKIVARCWGTDQGRSGCGKIWYRDQFQRVDLRERNKTVQEESNKKTASRQEHKQLIEEGHKAIFTKEFQAVLSYAKGRGFTEETIKKFQIGAMQKGDKKGLLLPVFKPNLYYQTRWIGWNKGSPYPKYQNPKGTKIPFAQFGEDLEKVIVVESLIDAMLIHAGTDMTTIAAMGAKLKREHLDVFERRWLLPDTDKAGNDYFGLSSTSLKYVVIELSDVFKDIGEVIQQKGLSYTSAFIKHRTTTLKSRLREKVEDASKANLSHFQVIDNEGATDCQNFDTLKKDQKDWNEDRVDAQVGRLAGLSIDHTKNKEPNENKTDREDLKPYVYITEMHQVERAVDKLLNTEGLLALDTETTGLDFTQDKIRLVQIKAESTEVFIFDIFKLAHVDFLERLKEKIFIMHHAPFDVKMLRAQGVEISHYHDTRLMGALIHPLPNPKEGKRDNLDRIPTGLVARDLSLRGLLKGWLDLEIPKEKRLRKGWQEEELSEEKLSYASRDVEHLHELYNTLLKNIRREGFSSIYETYGEALKAHIELEYLGAPVKTEALQKHLGTLDPLEETVEFIECFGIDNPHSNAQLSNYIKETYEGIDIPKTEKTGQLQLSGEILEELKDKDKLFQKLHAHRQKTQDYKEHKKLFEAISPTTGRVHASCRVLGASSGRTLTSNPNFQGQAKSVRSFIGVPEGSGLRITSADYSQQELRIFSILTRNETFLQILEEGGDGYKGVASTVLNKPMSEISEQERKVFKRVTLALLYGQGTKLLAGQLNKPIEETKKLYGEVKDILGVDVLQRKLKQEHKNGYVPTVFGKSTRKIIDRWQTLREYQLINYAIQGTASNIGILALIKLTKRLKGLGLVFGYIHDEFLVEHSLSEADRVKDVVKTAMEEAFLECFGEAERQRKFLVEVNINTHWEK